MNSKTIYVALAILLAAIVAGFLTSRTNESSTAWFDNPDAPWDLTDFHHWEIVDEQFGPALAVGDSVEPARGRRIVSLKCRRMTQSLVVHFPFGSYEHKTVPCVLVPSGGGNLITGTRPTASREVMKPYLSKGMIVISYELNGSIHPWDSRDWELLSDAYRQFVDVKAGLINSLNAVEYAVNEIDLVDPTKVFVAGYSSGGTHALLLAAHEPRLAGCVAYCPDADLADFDKAKTDALSDLYGIKAFVKKAAPLTHVQNVECPVMIYAVQDDEIIEFDSVYAYYETLKETNRDVVFRWAEYGGHATPYKTEGLEMGSKWISQIAVR